MSTSKLVMSVLFVAVLINAIAVIYVKQQSRDLYTEIRTLQKQQDNISIEWSRLQLQSSTLMNPAAVETIARNKLSMQSVEQPQYVVIR